VSGEIEGASHLMNTYKKSICLVKGDGSRVWDSSGKRYLDLIGGIATCSIGHNNPKLVEALAKQAARIINPSNLFHSVEQPMLAGKLCRLSGMDKCFFSNSGTEAVEAAIKLSRKCTGKTNIVAMKGSFHGRTIGSLSATWNPGYKKTFEPLVPGFAHAEYGDAESLRNLVDGSKAAVIVEPIQGEAGVIVPPSGYLKEVRAICTENDALLIADEVQTGNGRTGKFLCCMHEEVKPDIVTMAKGLANGVPIGATLSCGGLDFEPGDHGSTFGGNSLSCAAAHTTLGVIEEQLPWIGAKGQRFMDGLRNLDSPQIKEVRGKGLMVAIGVEKDAKALVQKCAEVGLLANAPNEKTVRFLPALTISMEELDEGVELFGRALKEALK